MKDTFSFDQNHRERERQRLMKKQKVFKKSREKHPERCSGQEGGEDKSLGGCFLNQQNNLFTGPGGEERKNREELINTPFDI